MKRTQKEINKIQRENRKATGNLCTFRYEKTPRGFLMRTYRNMRSRIEGVQWRKHHLYAGKDLLPKADFYRWAISSKAFKKLFSVWEASGYDRKLTPSPDRVDPTKGYLIDNMEWVTHSENSRRGSLSQWRNRAHN